MEEESVFSVCDVALVAANIWCTYSITMHTMTEREVVLGSKTVIQFALNPSMDLE